MESYPWFLLLSAALWLVFVGVWVRWVARRLGRRRRLREWPRAMAVLTEAWATRESVTTSDAGTSRYTVFHGRYELVDRQGRTRRGAFQTTRTRLSTGDEVEVMYDPDDPEAHEAVDGAAPAWAIAGILVVLTSLGLVMPAVITLYLGLGYD